MKSWLLNLAAYLFVYLVVDISLWAFLPRAGCTYSEWNDSSCNAAGQLVGWLYWALALVLAWVAAGAFDKWYMARVEKKESKTDAD